MTVTDSRHCATNGGNFTVSDLTLQCAHPAGHFLLPFTGSCLADRLQHAVRYCHHVSSVRLSDWRVHVAKRYILHYRKSVWASE